MTDTDDPLLPFLQGELDQIEGAVGLSRRLLVPVVPIDDVPGEPKTFNWSFRFTWQEVERGRRYVMPLDRERALAAQQAVIDEIVQSTMSQIISDVGVSSESIEQASDDLEILTWTSDDGAIVEFPVDPQVLALPVSEIRRRIRFRARLNVYSISESVSVGPLRLLRSELVRILRSAAGKP